VTPNEALKEVCLELAKDLATVISGCLIDGIIPTSLKESTIIVLRKERKQDYSLLQSY